MKLFHKNKQIKRSNDSIVKILMPSLLGIGFCVISLLGTTFAWFTDNVSIHTQIIESADYSVDIQIKDGNDIVEPDNNGIYTLSKKGEGQGYEVSIIPTGTASTGFCIINDNLLTEQINQGETLTFTLYPDADSKEYTFNGIWGTPPENSKTSRIKNSDIVGTPSSESYVEEVNNNINNNVNNNVNNNLSIPNVGNVESEPSQPEKIESTTPSEEPEVEEDNEITESDSSDTEINNSDIILDTTKEPSEESKTDTTNEYNTIN